MKSRATRLAAALAIAIPYLSACGGANESTAGEDVSAASVMTPTDATALSAVNVASTDSAVSIAETTASAADDSTDTRTAQAERARRSTGTTTTTTPTTSTSTSKGTSSSTSTSTSTSTSSAASSAAATAANAALIAANGLPTYRADQFIDSVGVNIHLSYTDTIYAQNFSVIKTRLTDLGVKHVRDGIVDTSWTGYYTNHAALAAAGIGSIFIASWNQTPALLAGYPAKVADFEGYEAPNEMDISGDSNWVADLKSSLNTLHALRKTASLAKWPLYGPSLTSQGAYAALGDVSGLIDYGNIHNYYDGRNPGTGGWGDNGYGSIAWNVAVAKVASGSKTIITTETGYHDSASAAHYLPPAVIARYMPRVYLEQYREGIPRTYIYELADFNNSGNYGLLNSDGSAKPSYTALQNLMKVLTPTTTLTTTAVALPFKLVGGDSNVHQMAFQKGTDGTYEIATWIESPAWDVNAVAALTVPSQTATLTLGSGVTMSKVYSFQDTGAVTTTTPTNTTGSSSLTITDHLTVIEVKYVKP